MAQEHEKAFETELCEYPEAHGWLYSKNGEGYDRDRALFPEDVFGWLEDTQPDELAKVLKPGASAADEEKSRAQFLDRLVKVLDTPLASGEGGTLYVLRNGFKRTPAKFKMCEFKPATTLNKATAERYGKVRVKRPRFDAAPV